MGEGEDGEGSGERTRAGAREAARGEQQLPGMAAAKRATIEDDGGSNGDDGGNAEEGGVADRSCSDGAEGR